MTYSTTKEWFAMSPAARYGLVRKRIRYMKMLSALASRTPFRLSTILECANKLLSFGK